MTEAPEKLGLPHADEEENLNNRQTIHNGAKDSASPAENLPDQKVEANHPDQPIGEQQLLIDTTAEQGTYPFYRSPPSIDLCKSHQQASRCDNEYNFLSIDDQHSKLLLSEMLESPNKSRVCQCCHKFGVAKSN